MKKAILLVVAAMFAVLMMAPAAFADEMDEDTAMGMEDTAMMDEDTAMGMEDDDEDTVSGMGTDEGDLPESGGPAILLPAAALLLGSGILTFAVLRRK
ncbi:MAG: hypothetical protein ACRDSJ_03820 [Rubrobacteraceae bacterium]